MRGVIIGFVRPRGVDESDFLRWVVVEAGDALLDLGDTVETMVCTEGSLGGTPGPVRFDALVWAHRLTADPTPLLEAAEHRHAIDGWGLFALGAERGFERRQPDDETTRVDERFSRLPGRTTPGVKKVVFHCRRGDISREEYRTAFRDHLPLTEEHMALASRYWQREVDTTAGSSRLPTDGVSEFWSPDDDTIKRLYDNAESASIVGADSTRFIDRTLTCTLFGIAHLRT